MRNGTRFVLLIPLLLVALGKADAGELPLEKYAVRIVHGRPDDPSKIPHTGNAGIYLGDGLVLTAAHVAGSQLSPSPLFVLAEQRLLEARFVKAGDFATVDVSLLAVDMEKLPESMRQLPALKLCPAPPVPGQDVTVVEQQHLTGSVIVPADVLPSDIRGTFGTLIRDVYSTGNSGAGVFDSATRCLMGIMSRKIERKSTDGNGAIQTEGVAKYFVPSATIRRFLDGTQ